jgi:hypothetical protein
VARGEKGETGEKVMSVMVVKHSLRSGNDLFNVKMNVFSASIYPSIDSPRQSHIPVGWQICWRHHWFVAGITFVTVEGTTDVVSRHHRGRIVGTTWPISWSSLAFLARTYRLFCPTILTCCR